MYVQPFSVHILLDRGRVEQARQVLEESRSTLRIGDSVRLFLEAEARVLLEEGRPAQALAVLDEAEQQMQVVRNPVWRSWRTQRADVLHALGRTADGLALLDEEQRLAEEWGTPGPQGRTWLVRGRLEGSEGAASLRTAVELLARSQHRLDLARARRQRALVDDPVEARTLLAAALESAEDCGAEGLWQQTADRLRLWGSRSRTGRGPRPG